jgi:hypothetical protein
MKSASSYLLHQNDEKDDEVSTGVEVVMNGNKNDYNNNPLIFTEEIHLQQALDGSQIYQSLRNLSLSQQQKRHEGEEYTSRLATDLPTTPQAIAAATSANTSSTTTTTTAHKVLQEIDKVQEKRRQAGLNEINFTAGVLNVLLIAYVFGAYPQHFWILYVVESFYFIPYKCVLLWYQRPLRGICYLLDFCWVMNILGVILLLIFCHHSGPFTASSTVRKEVFMATFGICCGPLLGATAALPFVAFVFHDIGTMTGLFIHILPPMLMYTLRWHSEALHNAYPQIFQLDYLEDMRFFPTSSSINGGGSILGNASLIYVSWFIPYTSWMLLQGLDLPRKSANKPGPPTYDTVFHSLWRPGLCETCGTLMWKRSPTLSRVQMEQDDYETRDFLLYMLGHATLAGISILTLANLCSLGPVLHGILLTLVVIICVYRGAQRYTYYVTVMYGKVIRKQLGDF